MVVVQPNSHLSASLMAWKRFKDFGGRELVSPISISFVGSGHLFLDCGLWTDCAALKAAGLYAVHYDTVKSSALMDSALQCSVV